MRVLLFAALVAGVWLLVRRRRHDAARVVVGWTDGSALELGNGSARDRLVSIARDAFA